MKSYCQIIEWVANKRMKAIGLDPYLSIKLGDNPLPWTMHWLNSSGLQNALKKLRLNPISLEVSSKIMKRIHLRTSSYNEETYMASLKQYFCGDCDAGLELSHDMDQDYFTVGMCILWCRSRT